jgi:hypothetical protein
MLSWCKLDRIIKNIYKNWIIKWKVCTAIGKIINQIWEIRYKIKIEL